MTEGRSALEELRGQIAALERRLNGIQGELGALKERAALMESRQQPETQRGLPVSEEPAAMVVEPTPTQVPPRRAEVRSGGVFVEAGPAAGTVVVSRRVGRRRSQIAVWLEWLRARVLALTGAIVTLLGIFFFVNRAGERGWVGPELRIAIAGCAAAVTFGIGLWLRRRLGESHSAVAAVGVGIAGGYATLLFAAARYELVPDLAALAIAGGIAAVGVVRPSSGDPSSLRASGSSARSPCP
jgi:uncharacterized membrane protein